MPAIDPSFLTAGPEFSVSTAKDPAFQVDEAGGLSGLEGTPDAAGAGDGFGGVLGKQIDKLSAMQTDAADAGASLASGTATDPTEVVMAVERARLSMQMAAQLRTKGVDAVQEIFHTQV